MQAPALMKNTICIHTDRTASEIGRNQALPPHCDYQPSPSRPTCCMSIMRRILVALSSCTLLATVIALCSEVPVASAATPEHTFSIGTNHFLLDGRPLQIRCGEVHGPRVPKEYWRHRLQMARAMG